MSSEWTTDKAVEVVTRLIELTQEGKMVWEPSRNASPPRVGEPTTPPYYAAYNGQRWRVQGEMQKDQEFFSPFPISPFPRNSRREVVHLELVDGRERALLSVPDVPNLEDLLEAVQGKSASADDVVERLFS